MRNLSAALAILAIIPPCSAGAQETLAPADGPRHVLVADRAAKATIVLPEKPHELESHAADELAEYAQAITGAPLPIVREPEAPSGYGIWLGRTQKAESAGFTLTEARLGRDGYAARADDAGEQANTDLVRQRIAAIRDAFDQCEASIRRLEKK